MKTLKPAVTGILLIFACVVQAQVSVNVNIGSPPLWGPAGFSQARYYYLPDVEAYYDIQSSMFIYYGGGAWIHRTYLPARYKSYDLYGGYKVVMTNYHGSTPYIHFKEHKMKYAKGYHGKAQKNIGQRPGKENQGAKQTNEVKHGDKGGGNGNSKSGGHGHAGGKGKNK